LVDNGYVLTFLLWLVISDFCRGLTLILHNTLFELNLILSEHNAFFELNLILTEHNLLHFLLLYNERLRLLDVYTVLLWFLVDLYIGD